MGVTAEVPLIMATRKLTKSLSFPSEEKIKQLEREVTCQFCLNSLEDPRILECLHVYCKDCIQGMKLRSKEMNSYKCPQCTKQLIIEDVEKIPSFNIAKTKASDLKLLKQISEEQTSCDLCPLRKSAQEAVYVCRDCREGKQLLCDACSKPHLHRPEFKEHKMDLLSVFVASITDPRPSRRASTRLSTVCDAHGYQLRYFCTNCKMAACDDCRLENHLNHVLYETTNAVEYTKTLIASELPKILSIRNLVQESIKPIEEVKHKVIHQREFCMGEVQYRFNRIRKELETAEKMMKSQVNDMSMSKQDLLQCQLNLVSQLHERADRLTGMMSMSNEILDESSLISVANLFLRKSKEIIEDYDKAISMSVDAASPKVAVIKKQTTLSPCESADLSIAVPLESIKVILREQAKVFKVTAQPSSCVAFGPGLVQPQALHLTYFNVQLHSSTNKCIQQQELNVEINIQSIEGKVSEKSKIIYKGQGKYTVSYCPRVIGTCEIKVTVNKEDIRGSPFSVIVYPSSPLAFNSNHFSSLYQLERPCCVVLSSEGNVVVADKSSIVSLDVSAKELSRFSISLETSEDLCGGIAIDGDQYIYVSSLTYHRLSRYTPNGDLDSRIGEKGSNSSEFNAPCGIAIHSGSDEIFVCDSLNNRIQVFDLSLSFKREISLDFTKRGHERLRLPSRPIDITFDKENYLPYVTDSINNCVLSITSEGRLRYASWQVSGNQKELSSPQGITSDRDGYLYVCDSGKLCSY